MTDAALRQELIERGAIPSGTAAVSSELLRQQAMTDAALRQELIERGAIPSGTAAVSSELLRQQAMTDAALRQELIEQARSLRVRRRCLQTLLRQQAMTDAALRQELIDRGLIPGGTTRTGGVTPALTKRARSALNIRDHESITAPPSGGAAASGGGCQHHGDRRLVIDLHLQPLDAARVGEVIFGEFEGGNAFGRSRSPRPTPPACASRPWRCSWPCGPRRAPTRRRRAPRGRR